MLEHLVQLVTESAWAYPLVFAIAALDAVFPLVPSEATVITAAALAASGRLDLAAVFLAAVAGAAVGDNAAYLLGRVSGGAVRRAVGTSRVKPGMDWAARMLRARGATIVIVSRFVPGGRTGTMLTAGMTKLRWSRFATIDLVAAALWAGYGVALGSVGGVAFADRPLLAVVVALALAALLGLALEGARRWRQARRRETVAAAGEKEEPGA